MEKELSEEKKELHYTLNEDMNDIIKLIKSLEDSGVLIIGATETVKDEIKRRRWISWSFVSTFSRVISTISLVHPVISSTVKGISRRGVRRARRG